MIKLRPYQNSDAQTILSWIGDEVSFRKWCADRYDRYPITAEDMNCNYEQCMESGGFYPMTVEDDGEIVGHLILRYTDEARTIVRFGFIIVDDQKRGMGYGREMLIAAIRYAYEKLNAKKITLGVFENNPSAYRCYQSAGFREAGAEVSTFHIFDEDWKCIEMQWKGV